ncbi:MAG: SGNH/GDSL hydrolase family protein [Clostridia bacterium]|nr:SGNH/GDSL hydrolase family protein [Clostridia bacterium]
MKKIRTLACLLATLLCGGTLFACGGDKTDNGASNSSSDNSSTSVNDGPSEEEIEQAMKEDKLVTPFWNSDVMYDETVILVAPTDGDGKITALPSAKLLFEAEEILEVKQYFHVDNGNQIKNFTQDVDFTYADGVLTAVGTIGEDLFGMPTVNTTLPYVTDKQAKGIEAFPGLGTTTGIPSSEGEWEIPFTESYQIVQMQLSVTYRHSGEWTGAKPAYQGETLSTVVNKLKNKEDTEILIFGDSVATGANSSSLLGVEPYLTPWFTLTANKLSRYYGTKVNITNKSVGGWTSSNGVSSVASGGWINGTYVEQVGLIKLFETELAEYTPDLAILHFGLNDVTLGVSAQTYYENICKMINCIRDRNPNCDIIILGSLIANPEAKNQSKDLSPYTKVNNAIASQVYKNEHIVSWDIGVMHQELLAAGKKYLDMTGNNVNHPNDFIARIYAMNVLSLLIEA